MAMQIDIMRPGTPDSLIVTIKPDTGSSVSKKLLEENGAVLSFELNAMYNFNINDYADILGDRYYITQPPVVTKKSKYNFSYTIQLEAQQYKLRNAQYLFFDGGNVLGESDFTMTGTAEDFINLLMLNANRVNPGWIKGGVIATGYKTLNFSKEDCLAVLSRLASEFQTEFYLVGNTIHLAKKQQVTTQTFMYGRNMGFYTVGRSLVDEVLVTRLYVYGGNTNIPYTYRNSSPRLLMASEDTCAITDIMAIVKDDAPSLTHTYKFHFKRPLDPLVTELFIYYRAVGDTLWLSTGGTVPVDLPATVTIPNGDWEFLFRSICNPVNGPCNGIDTGAIHIPQDITAPQYFAFKPSVLEKNISKYGLVEGSVIMEDVYPTREGTVTAVDATDFYVFKDISMDFDVNEQLLSGQTAKVVFNSGQLAGYKFEIKEYNPTTKEFTILKNKDEKAIDLPSNVLRPAIGDKYILVDIIMPYSYVANAEKKLREEAIKYLDQKSEPSYKYTVECDPAYFRKKNIYLGIGDIVRIIDTDLQVDKAIRIIGLTRSLIDEFEYTIELGENVTPGTIAALQSSAVVNSSNIEQSRRTFNNNALLNGLFIGTFKIEQGTISVKDMPTAASITGMKQLYIDADGKIWKEP